MALSFANWPSRNACASLAQQKVCHGRHSTLRSVQGSPNCVHHASFTNWPSRNACTPHRATKVCQGGFRHRACKTHPIVLIVPVLQIGLRAMLAQPSRNKSLARRLQAQSSNDRNQTDPIIFSMPVSQIGLRATLAQPSRNEMPAEGSGKTLRGIIF